MKVICEISPRQIQRVLALSDLKDDEVEKISEALPKYQEIDITKFLDENDDDNNYAHLALASFAMGAIAKLEDA